MKNLEKYAAVITENFDDTTAKNLYDFLEGMTEDEKTYEVGCAAVLAAIGKKVVPACDYQSKRNYKDVMTIGKAIIMGAVEMRARGEWDYMAKFAESEF